MATPGKLFVFEGPDGVGKTTLSSALNDHLNATGIQCDYLSFPGRETGSLGRHVYEQQHAYPIRIISNNQSISATLNTVLQAIDQIAREPKIRSSVELDTHFSANTTPESAGAQLSIDFVFDTDNSSTTTVPTIITPLDPVKPTEVFDTYWRFAAERQNIFFRKLAGLPPPWTSDPILERHKFTNAYRASDRVSQYLIRHVIYTGDQSPEEVF